MFPLAGQTAGPNGLKFFVDTHESPGGDIEKNPRATLHLYIYLGTRYVLA